MSKINLSENHINSYKTIDDIKFKKVYDEWDRLNSNSDRRIFIINDEAYEEFKIKQAKLKLKRNIEECKFIKQYGFIGSAGSFDRL